MTMHVCKGSECVGTYLASGWIRGGIFRCGTIDRAIDDLFANAPGLEDEIEDGRFTREQIKQIFVETMERWQDAADSTGVTA